MSKDKRIYYDKDGSFEFLKDRTIAIIGYGNQGRSQALNMRDSGVDGIIVGSPRDKSWKQAERDEFEVYSIEEAAKRSDIMFILIPDEVAPEVYGENVEDNLEEEDVLVFASGYNITFDFIQPPDYTDVILLAPRMIGKMVRELYERGKGAPGFMAVNQDFSGNAKGIALALAKAIGLTRAGVIEGSFEMETKVDLLTEQGLQPIIFSAMIAKYELEVEEGILPEAILLEEYLSGEMAHVFEQMAEEGILGQLPLHSSTSQYGQLSRTNELLEERNEKLAFDDIKNYMREQLSKIDTGEFAKEWSIEQDLGKPTLKRLYKKFRNSEFIKDEQRVMEKLKSKEEDTD